MRTGSSDIQFQGHRGRIRPDARPRKARKSRYCFMDLEGLESRTLLATIPVATAPGAGQRIESCLACDFNRGWQREQSGGVDRSLQFSEGRRGLEYRYIELGPALRIRHPSSKRLTPITPGQAGAHSVAPPIRSSTPRPSTPLPPLRIPR